jgi:hypothetical protein
MRDNRSEFVGCELFRPRSSSGSTRPLLGREAFCNVEVVFLDSHRIASIRKMSAPEFSDINSKG